MKIHYLLHAPFEKLGAIKTWAYNNQLLLTENSPYKGDPLPHTNDFDMLILMGGPQSALDYKQYPYLVEEIKLIQQSIAQNKIILGICLGAQLISLAFDAEPEKSPEKEVGMFPIQLTDAAQQSPLFSHFPNELRVMHWHNDMPGIPENAKVLAKSAGCPRQIIQYKQNVFGFQCHLELTRDTTQALINNTKNDLAPSLYTQTAASMLEEDFSEQNQCIIKFLEQLVA